MDVQCNRNLLNAESFDNCRTICEGILNVGDEESSPGTRSSSGSRARGRENCRCLCKSLHIKQSDCPGKERGLQMISKWASFFLLGEGGSRL